MTDLDQLLNLVQKEHYAVYSVKTTSKGTTLITLKHKGCSCCADDQKKPAMLITTDQACVARAQKLMQQVRE